MENQSLMIFLSNARFNESFSPRTTETKGFLKFADFLFLLLPGDRRIENPLFQKLLIDSGFRVIEKIS